MFCRYKLIKIFLCGLNLFFITNVCGFNLSDYERLLTKINMDTLTTGKLKNEKTVRIQAERKVVVMESKITDLDNNKKILEKKLKELESKMQLGSKNLESRLDEKLEEINGTSSNLNNLEIEYEKLKIEHEKLKSIISYVRENYK